jgi:hypothetical protein
MKKKPMPFPSPNPMAQHFSANKKFKDANGGGGNNNSLQFHSLSSSSSSSSSSRLSGRFPKLLGDVLAPLISKKLIQVYVTCCCDMDRLLLFSEVPLMLKVLVSPYAFQLPEVDFLSNHVTTLNFKSDSNFFKHNTSSSSSSSSSSSVKSSSTLKSSSVPKFDITDSSLPFVSEAFFKLLQWVHDNSGSNDLLANTVTSSTMSSTAAASSTSTATASSSGGIRGPLLIKSASLHKETSSTMVNGLSTVIKDKFGQDDDNMRQEDGEEEGEEDRIILSAADAELIMESGNGGNSTASVSIAADSHSHHSHLPEEPTFTIPPQLKLELKSFQKDAVQWMLSRESNADEEDDSIIRSNRGSGNKDETYSGDDDSHNHNEVNNVSCEDIVSCVDGEVIVTKAISSSSSSNSRNSDAHQNKLNHLYSELSFELWEKRYLAKAFRFQHGDKIIQHVVSDVDEACSDRGKLSSI